jgi:transposase
MTLSTTIECKRAVFAGIDFHKRFSVVSLGDSSGKLLMQEKLSNDEHSIRKFFLRHGPLKCAIENSRANEWFIELLKQCNCEVKVSNTYAVKLIAASKCKNDKIDSQILMELLARDYLPTCYQPTPEEKKLREQLRWRTRLMRSRTQYKNTAHALMDKENKGAKLHSRKQRNELYEGQVSSERQKRLEKNLEVIEFFEERLDSEDVELTRLVKANPEAELLKTIPGVGTISALMLIAELGDVSRFKNAKRVAGYFGLVPRLYASSDTRRLGSITKQGSGAVRRILVQDAWHAIKTSKAFRQKYNTILKRRGKKVAIVAIARMIAEIAYRILKDKVPFEESKLTLG